MIRDRFKPGVTVATGMKCDTAELVNDCRNAGAIAHVMRKKSELANYEATARVETPFSLLEAIDRPRDTRPIVRAQLAKQRLLCFATCNLPSTGRTNGG